MQMLVYIGIAAVLGLVQVAKVVLPVWCILYAVRLFNIIRRRFNKEV
jgi:hypothetical protein